MPAGNPTSLGDEDHCFVIGFIVSSYGLNINGRERTILCMASSDKKAEVFFKNLDMSGSFPKRLHDIRRSFDIPLSGYKSIKRAQDWLWTLEEEGENGLFKRDGRYEKWKAYEKAKGELLRDYKIPPSLAGVLDGKILCANGVLKPDQSIRPWESSLYGCSLVDLAEEDHFYNFRQKEYWKGHPAAVLFIHAGTSQEDVKKYLGENWHRIKKMADPHKKSKGIRSASKRSRDEVVYGLCEKPTKELIREVRELMKLNYPDDDTYIGVDQAKERYIQQILRMKYKYPKKTTSEGNIKRICAEQRHLRR